MGKTDEKNKRKKIKKGRKIDTKQVVAKFEMPTKKEWIEIETEAFYEAMKRLELEKNMFHYHLCALQ